VKKYINITYDFDSSIKIPEHSPELTAYLKKRNEFIKKYGKRIYKRANTENPS